MHKHHFINGTGWASKAICAGHRMTQQQLIGSTDRKLVNCTLCLRKLAKMDALKARDRDKKKHIAELNDLCRTAMGVGGHCVQTSGFAALPRTIQSAIREKIETFNDFTHDNDPYGERDFGSIKHEDVTVFWKIDYYAPAMEQGSDDPSDPNKTVRVMTIMLAEEY